MSANECQGRAKGGPRECHGAKGRPRAPRLAGVMAFAPSGGRDSRAAWLRTVMTALPANSGPKWFNGSTVQWFKRLVWLTLLMFVDSGGSRRGASWPGPCFGVSLLAGSWERLLAGAHCPRPHGGHSGARSAAGPAGSPGACDPEPGRPTNSTVTRTKHVRRCGWSGLLKAPEGS